MPRIKIKTILFDSNTIVIHKKSNLLYVIPNAAIEQICEEERVEKLSDLGKNNEIEFSLLSPDGSSISPTRHKLRLGEIEFVNYSEDPITRNIRFFTLPIFPPS